ncbi:MAG: hypothetical protein D6772_04905 [Bacteroidetes bacterium]|nr:MAG: hypothetical protein D6772_04905 [Bacteroidota bacterium]
MSQSNDNLKGAQRPPKAYRFFTWQLIRVALTAEYKKSFVGLLWLLILPLISVVIWTLLNGAGVINPGPIGVPYPAYVLLSTSIWGFFADIYSTTSQVLTNHSRILLTAHFPLRTLITERIVVHLIRFSIPLILNLLVLVYFGVDFGWKAWYFPFAIVPLMLLGAGLGLLVSLFRVLILDVAQLADQSIKLLMYLSPVVYSPRLEAGWLADVIYYNPLTYLLGYPRDLLTLNRWFEPTNFAIVTVGTLLFFAWSVRVFQRHTRKAMERLINN